MMKSSRKTSGGLFRFCMFIKTSHQIGARYFDYKKGPQASVSLNNFAIVAAHHEMESRSQVAERGSNSRLQ